VPSAGHGTDVAKPTAVATGLLGPFADRDDPCAALTALSKHPFPFASRTCTASPIDVAPDGSVSAALLAVRDAKPTDPRLAGSGAYFLALSIGRAWFVGEAPLDETSSAAGTTYLPTISEPLTSFVGRSPPRMRVLFVFRDNTEAICNACKDGMDARPKPRESHGVVVVCGRVGSGKPQCTAPLAVKTASQVSFDADDDLTVEAPGALPVQYTVRF
jgi:hypothetical protein